MTFLQKRLTRDDPAHLGTASGIVPTKWELVVWPEKVGQVWLVRRGSGLAPGRPRGWLAALMLTSSGATGTGFWMDPGRGLSGPAIRALQGGRRADGTQVRVDFMP